MGVEESVPRWVYSLRDELFLGIGGVLRALPWVVLVFCLKLVLLVDGGFKSLLA